MELWLVADTNLFFECKPLNQLPWEGLAHDPVVVLLTKPVLDEIDKHKKGGGRTRDRALDIFGRVRTMLTTKTTEVELRPSSPRVTLRLDSTRPDPALKDDLDYGKVDEKLVGIVSALSSQTQGCVVELFTDDTGPASTASGMGLPFRMIEGSWRRPPSESTETKKIKELEKDLATYRAQEPRIKIAACEGADQSGIVSVTRRIATPLTEGEIGELLASLCAKHPKKTDFVPPPATSITEADGEIVRTEWHAPSEEEIAGYDNVRYPQWVELCRGALETLHQGRDVPEPDLVIRWPMSNVGTRPASQVRIEFEAHGPLKLLRVSEREDDVPKPLIRKSPPRGPSRAAPIPRFPSPPKSPEFRANITRTPAPARPEPPMASMGASSAVASEILRQRRGELATSFASLERAGMIPLSRHLGLNIAMGEAAHLLGRSSMLDQTIKGSLVAVATPTTFALPIFANRSLRHDSEGFYWDWPEHETVAKGALTCDLWRHQADEELFTFSVKFDQDDAARGIVLCTVHAENLTKPEQAKVIVGRNIEPFTVKDIAEGMVEDCG